MKFNNELITEETIIKTIEHFKNIYLDQIKGAKNKEFYVNDLNEYIKDRNEQIKNIEERKNLNNFTFLQRAYWIQTGKMMSLFR